eukprot:9337876-Alexandrium_andersonii.AAC.1
MGVATVIRARARTSHGKVSGDDSIVAEMLKELPMIAVYLASHLLLTCIMTNTQFQSKHGPPSVSFSFRKVRCRLFQDSSNFGASVSSVSWRNLGRSCGGQFSLGATVELGLTISFKSPTCSHREAGSGGSNSLA